MPTVIVQGVGGILVALYLVGSAGLNIVNEKIFNHQQVVNEQIEQEIEEFQEDYEYCEEVYIQNLITNGEIEAQITQEEYLDIRDEFAEIYKNNLDERDINIDTPTLNYMKEQLPKDVQETLDKRKGYGRDIDGDIVYNWIRYKIIN